MTTAAASRPKTTPKPKAAAPQPDRAIRAASDRMKQAADPTRLRVILILAEGERHVGALCEAIGQQSQPAVSHHLALLRHGGIIAARRSGKHNFYGLTEAGQELARAAKGIMGG